MDRRDRLMGSVEPLLQSEDWRSASCQANLLKVVAALWPSMAPRRREYLVRHVDADGELSKPKLNFREWCMEQDFTCAIMSLLKAEALPDDVRGFVRSMARNMKDADWQPSQKQFDFAVSLARDWGPGGEIQVTEEDV